MREGEGEIFGGVVGGVGDKLLMMGTGAGRRSFTILGDNRGSAHGIRVDRWVTSQQWQVGF